MTKIRSIQIKAAFVLTVFALNTLVAFACSLGLKMGYNNAHHGSEKASHALSADTHKHAGHNNHDVDDTHQQEKNTPAKDDCCTTNAKEFSQADKSLDHQSTPTIKAPVFIAWLSSVPGQQIKSSEKCGTQLVIIPRKHPPPDIRIAIQSFQI